MPANIDTLRNFVEKIETSTAVVRCPGDGKWTIEACNPLFFKMMGRHQDVMRPLPVSLDLVVPSYARRELRAAMNKCLTEREPQELAQAFDLKTGSTWWRLSMSPLAWERDGQNEGFVFLSGIDITARIAHQHELEANASRFKAVVDAAYDAIITIDQRQRITLFNRAAERLFGYDQAEMIDQSLEALIPEKSRDVHHGYIHQFSRSPVKSRQMDDRNLIYGLRRDGSLIPVEIAISKINVEGLFEFAAVIRDITERAQFLDQLHRQATTDPLTGLANRRQLGMRADALMKEESMISVLILDIDDFKQINDSFGHETGDDVLRVVAEVATDALGSRDVLSRTGGDEFVGIIPAADCARATEIAESLRNTFERLEYRAKEKSGEPVRFTTSIGVATRLQSDVEIGNLLRRADQALYRAKRGGRNRVEVA